ncbi:alpha-ketoglutarate-dependent dioxygenase AlkB family protein [Ferrimonas balearica]|uniref:alpha-ketoglutarate-dependent dioxygenase AlkB family protein n=1 Tax=Ferrimonas balearica TaxID=44012 RepID=UPI001C99D614|nr:alpha-ketoglutarate-dependent dioxygenase AlkB [Ferrimonas balearica]MBY5921436.1 alpha-ketoglutarate-dependent dioxygenase AlkB [Ferrimonas balearica]MBY5995879.1 alpha-ketoglutarate-dependent dioxygenase AlkB [Ferrimonas balearica]
MPDPEQCIRDNAGRVLARVIPNWIPAEAQSALWPVLDALPWQQPDVQIFGRRHPIPRQQCYLGHPGCEYRYSGLLLSPEPVPDAIQALMDRLGEGFNAVLVNRYRHGQDRMGWHRDNEPELAPDLAILSLGGTRRLRLRFDAKDSHGVDLPSGSLLWLSPGVYHCLAPTARPVSERVSLTFRQIQPGFHHPCPHSSQAV